MTERCGICGKFIKVPSYDDTRLCPTHITLLEDFDKISSAIFDLEQKLKDVEKAEICRPLYRARCNLGEMEYAFKRGNKVCEFVSIWELSQRIK